MMTTLPNRVSALFADPLQTVFSEMNSTAPWNRDKELPRTIAPLCLWEDANAFFVEMDVPGLNEEDLDISIHKGHLTIKGVRKAAPQSTGSCYHERQFGEFERSVLIDEWVDPKSVEATLQDGVLRLKFAKKPESQHQRIAINHGANGRSKRIEDQTT